MKKNIYVSSPSLPDLNNYNHYLKQIWSSKILTHNGPLVQELEDELKVRLKVNHLVSMCNGTSAIQAAIRVLDVKGEIITTPFTWIATINSILWENCTPVFVDVDLDTFNIDVSKIEEKISNKTCAILGVHTFSNPCDVKKIDKIAKKFQLKVIYDAAHAMFVNVNRRSILSYGDVSSVSFHATKVFNTVEGGACITKSKAIANRLKRVRFFGFDEKKRIRDIGINMKMTEVHAAMGLCNLVTINSEIEKRKKLFDKYKEFLEKSNDIQFQKIDKYSYNYSYMPIIIKSKSKLKKIISKLQENNIYPRRYFYPSLNKIKNIKNGDRFLNSEYLSERIICLPMYASLNVSEVKKISFIINKYV